MTSILHSWNLHSHCHLYQSLNRTVVTTPFYSPFPDHIVSLLEVHQQTAPYLSTSSESSTAFACYPNFYTHHQHQNYYCYLLLLPQALNYKNMRLQLFLLFKYGFWSFSCYFSYRLSNLSYFLIYANFLWWFETYCGVSTYFRSCVRTMLLFVKLLLMQDIFCCIYHPFSTNFLYL
jgi:hypothetical protein